MLDKFNFYDVLGYLIPGSIVVLALYWVGVAGFGLQLPALSGDLGSSLVFVGAGYVTGHLIHAIGHDWEHRLSKRTGGRLSERLLIPSSSRLALEPHQRFSADLQESITSNADELFALASKPTDVDAPDAASWRSELFERCYALLVQEDAVQHTEVFLAINGLSRQLFVAAWITLTLSLLLADKQAVLWALRQDGFNLSTAGTWQPDGALLAMGLLGFVASLVGGLLVWRNFHAFREYFAKSVYFSFIAWCAKQQFKSK